VGSYTSIQPAGGDTATPLNLRKRLSLILGFGRLSGLRVIDCGCGAGDYVVALRQLGADAWGVEYDAEKVRQFKVQHRASGRLCAGDVSELGFRDGSFDVALLNEVLEHVPDDERALSEVCRVLKDGGRLFVFSPNRRYPFETHGVTLIRTEKRLPHYLPFVPYLPLRIGQRIFSYWARNYWPAELRDLVTRAGLTIEATDYVWQTFEGISCDQPPLIASLSVALRKASNLLERTPVIRSLGVSQVIVARKQAGRTRLHA
jgi:ubiquinone/menaquinone biosynthesis C-methylase UbiE